MTESALATAGEQPEVRLLPTGLLRPGPYQVRLNSDPNSLARMAASLKSPSDIINPIRVERAEDGGYDIIAGEQRWRAATLAMLPLVPVIITSVKNPVSGLVLGLRENIERSSLTDIEEAQGYSRLRKMGLSHKEILVLLPTANSEKTIANKIRLLSLDQEAVNHIQNRALTYAHGLQLLRLDDIVAQRELANLCVSRKWAVSALKSEIDRILYPGANMPQKSSPSPYAEVEQKFQDILGCHKFGIKRTPTGFTVTFMCKNEDELETALTRIR